MPMTTRAVFGYVRKADGTAYATAPVTIQSFPGVFQPDGSVAPAITITLTTDANGRYDTVLVTNARYLFGIPGDVFDVVLLAGAGSVSVESLRGSTNALMSNAVQTAIDAAVIPYTPTAALSEFIDDRAAALLQAGANVTLVYNDALGTLTISATGGGGGVEALEAVRVIGAAGQPAYQNSWGANTGTSFYKDRGRAYIYISAFNSSAVGNQTVFTLPVDCRPTQLIYFYEFFQFATRRWKIQTDGAVVYEGGNGFVLSEIGVDFRLA